MEELKEIEIEFKTHKSESGMLCLDNYEEILSVLTTTQKVVEGLNVDLFNYKQAKKYRATLNNTVKQLTSLKTSFLKDYVWDYDTKSKELTKILKETSEKVDEKVKKYEEENGLLKPALLTLTVKSYDKEKLEKLVEYAKTLELLGEIK